MGVMAQGSPPAMPSSLPGGAAMGVMAQGPLSAMPSSLPGGVAMGVMAQGPPSAMPSTHFVGSGLGCHAGGGAMGATTQGYAPPPWPTGCPTATTAAFNMGPSGFGGAPSPTSVLNAPNDARFMLGDPVLNEFLAKAPMHVRQVSLRLVQSARDRTRSSRNSTTADVPKEPARYLDWFFYFCKQRGNEFLLGPPSFVLQRAIESIQESAPRELTDLVLRYRADDLAARMVSGNVDVPNDFLAMAALKCVREYDQQGVATISAMNLTEHFRSILEQVRVAPRPGLGDTHHYLLFQRLECNNPSNMGTVEELILKANGFVQTKIKGTGAAALMEWKWHFDSIAGLFARFGWVWQYAPIPATIFLMLVPPGPLRDHCSTRRMIAENGGRAWSEEALFAQYVQIAQSLERTSPGSKPSASVNVVEVRESNDPKGNSSHITCWHCKKAGHRVQVCPTVGKATAGSDQKIVTGLYCRTCKHLGHKKQLCPSNSSSTNSESSKNDSPPHSRPGVGGTIQP